MKKRFVKLRVFSGALMMILVLIYGVIVGQSFDEKYFLLSLVVGILIGWLIGFLLKRIDSNTKGKGKAPKLSLNEGEKIIIEGIAKQLRNETRVDGKLVLTDDRLIFTSPDSINQFDFALGKIEGVYLYKNWRIFNKGITIAIDGKEEWLEVEYPNDWKKIITKQQEVTLNLENSVL